MVCRVTAAADSAPSALLLLRVQHDLGVALDSLVARLAAERTARPVRARHTGQRGWRQQPWSSLYSGPYHPLRRRPGSRTECAVVIDVIKKTSVPRRLETERRGA